MKNLLIYINPRKNFDDEHYRLARIQIDNSFRLGWQPEEMLMATNFPYEYNGFKALEVPDYLHCRVKDQSSKIGTISYLFSQGLLKGVTWFHDFDAFQVNHITEADLSFGNADLALTDYGWNPKWNTGSFFFKESARDLFYKIDTRIQFYNFDEEMALMLMTGKNIGGINNRTKRLNVTYNLGMKRVEENYERAEKPLRVVHFHPGKRNLMERFKPLLGKELTEVMGNHGYQ